MCRAEACKSVGADHLVDQARRVCGVDLGGTSKDNAVTLEAAYCLGLCASGPAALVDGRPVARLTPARVDALLTRMMEGG
jgi:formate dehydrogenase subunit gamma